MRSCHSGDMCVACRQTLQLQAVLMPVPWLQAGLPAVTPIH